MSSEKSNKLRSYHGNHANYRTEEYKDQFGKTVKKEVCYFNKFYEKAYLEKNCKDFRNFGYLFGELYDKKSSKKYSTPPLLPKSEKTIKNLKALADQMIDDAVKDPKGKYNSSIPPGYTYWGQFLDHDITAGTDRSHEFTITKPDFDPVAPQDVVNDVVNMRTPFFDLDSIYGDSEGPFGVMHRLYDPNDVVKFRIDQNDNNGNVPGSVPHAELGLNRDLPRNGTSLLANTPTTIAVIGDGRNDENTIVGQFHLALLKFHNCIIDEIRKRYPNYNLKALFYEARKEVTYHYQWLILNDFLKRILDKDIYLMVKREFDEGQSNIFQELGHDQPFMPLEFSTAAYRFGHSMVRNVYDFNQNFGTPGEVLPDAPFNLLFDFTGKGGERLKGSGRPTITSTLPFNWIIDWDRFFDTDLTAPGTNRFARRIDTKIAIPLTEIVNNDFDLLNDQEKGQVEVPESQFNSIMRHLSKRNLLRGYLLSIPTAQAIIDFLAHKGILIDKLSENQLKENNSKKLNKLLEDSGFLYQTPLWYYILKEAEVTNDGNKLGHLGSYIVGKTFVAFLNMKGEKYCNPFALPAGWNPEHGIVEKVTNKKFAGIMDLLRFAKVATSPYRDLTPYPPIKEKEWATK